LTDEPADIPPASRLLGREWLGFDETGQFARVRFKADASFTNRHGTIQGGFLAAMLDSATALRALAAVSADQTVVTSSLNTRFLKPARVGELIARAWLVEQNDREITVMAELIDAHGLKVAEATAGLRVLTRK
jgi:uncharacterized protein (TIGR00369 family)